MREGAGEAEAGTAVEVGGGAVVLAADSREESRSGTRVMGDVGWTAAWPGAGPAQLEEGSFFKQNAIN